MLYYYKTTDFVFKYFFYGINVFKINIMLQKIHFYARKIINMQILKHFIKICKEKKHIKSVRFGIDF